MKRLALLVVLLAASHAPLAASALEAARAAAAAARERTVGLRSQQMARRAELNREAANIGALKAQSSGPLLPGSKLEQALRHSQELSTSLTGLAQSLAQAEAAQQTANLALLEALSQEVARLRTAWERTTDRSAREALIAQLKRVRQERESVRAQLPAAAVPALDAAAEPVDDPAELLQEVDAVRDAEDKVRQRLQTLQARIHEVREERELDRRLSDFASDEALFDEQDRRLRLRRDPRADKARVDDGTPSLSAGAPMDTSHPSRESGAPEGGAVSSDIGGGSQPSGNFNTGVVDTTVRAADNRPQVGRAVNTLGNDSDDLKALEAEQQWLEKQAAKLKARADHLEQRARELK